MTRLVVALKVTYCSALKVRFVPCVTSVPSQVPFATESSRRTRRPGRSCQDPRRGEVRGTRPGTVVPRCRVCRTGVRPRPQTWVPGGWVLDGEGVGVGVHASRGGQKVLVASVRAVIVIEGCDGCRWGAFSDFSSDARPQDGQVMGGSGAATAANGVPARHEPQYRETRAA